MCGICGIIDFKKALDLPLAIQRMTDVLEHRGPDDGDIKILSAVAPEYPSIALGHRRLSVIDLSPAGRQPMAGANDATLIVLNGEIYNFKAKRSECADYPYRSNSDTEVVLAVYEKYHENFVDHIDGMFALALWDAREQKLFLARDRVGKKPLFYFCGRDFFLFSSEIKSLLTVAGLPLTQNPHAVPLYLTYGYIPTPDTFYAEIKKLEPGTLMVLDASGNVSKRRYWQYPVSEARGQAEDVPLHEREEKLRLLLSQAVSCRMIADVPLGAFLSGGIDSSIIVASMSQLSKEPIRTFSIGFEGDPLYDETHYARMAATAFGAKHTEFKVKPNAIELLGKLLWHYDEPFGDSSAIPTYLVSQMAREHVTVALSGDGGDELFAGYERFAAALWTERIPKPILAAGRILTGLMPTPAHAKSRRRRIRRFFEKSTLDFLDRYLEWNSFFTRAELRTMLRFPEIEDVALSFRNLIQACPAASVLQRVLYLNFHTYLLDDLLVKTDRTSMAHGLEVRCPFLDTHLVEWAAALPDCTKIRGRQLKHILKRAYRRILPREILARSKMGFGVPLGYWMRHELRDFSHDMLLGPSALTAQCLHSPFVKNLILEHENHIQDHGQRIWSLLCLELWLRKVQRLRCGSSFAEPNKS